MATGGVLVESVNVGREEVFSNLSRSDSDA